MIAFPITVTCDNDKCPDEAKAEARFEGALLSEPDAATPLVGSVELPKTWIEGMWFGLRRVYCSQRCAEAAHYQGQS